MSADDSIFALARVADDQYDANDNGRTQQVVRVAY
jgi:hypothetical protein